MQTSKLLLTLLLGLATANSHAAVYGYVDEQGVSHFSSEKLDARYQLLVRGSRFGSLEVESTGPGMPPLSAWLTEHPNLKKYAPLLKSASMEFAVELALLKAVMAAESGFNPDAISPKGAIGLMQVMPSTAERYGLRADKGKTLEQKLRDPKTNIRLATHYLADLFKLFPEQRNLVIASYNAGEGAVRQYKNDIPPFPETRSYVQLVTQLYYVYQPRSTVRKLGAGVIGGTSNGTKRVHLTIRLPSDTVALPSPSSGR